MEKQSLYESTFSQWKGRETEGKVSATHYVNSVSTTEKFLVMLRTTNETNNKRTNSIPHGQT